MVAANAWMNAPSGFTLDSNGEVIAVDPIGVIFNDSMPFEAAHMVVAAYLVGGFLIASVYAAGDASRPQRPLPPARASPSPFTVAAMMTPVQMGVGDALARWVYDNQPVKFAAIELVPTTARTFPRRCSATSTRTARSLAGSRSRASPRGFPTRATGKSTVVQGLDSVPADDRPTIRETERVHLAWDIMVGLGTLLFLLSAWYAASWLVPPADAPEQVVPGAAAVAGVLAVVTHRGRMGRDRGRPPAVDRLQPHEGRGCGDHEHRGLDHVHVVVPSTRPWESTTILVLRAMSRRFRRAGGFVDDDTPYGPDRRDATAPGHVSRDVTDGADDHGRRDRAARWRSSRMPSSGVPTSARASGT